MSRRRRRHGQGQDVRDVRDDRDGFWAESTGPTEPPQPITPTPEPAALLRSLGDPPLAPAGAAQHYLTAVYEEAVRAATALAAANSLLGDDGPPPS